MLSNIDQFDIFINLLMLSYYLYIPQTPKSKGFVCMIATFISVLTVLINISSLKSDPFGNYTMVPIVHSFMISYLIIDLIYILLKPSVRYDLLIHHIICIGSYLKYTNTLIMCYATMAEILSIWPFFDMEYFQSIKFRGMSIFVRYIIWLIPIFVLDINDIFIKILSIMMISLDTFWLYKIICILRS